MEAMEYFLSRSMSRYLKDIDTDRSITETSPERLYRIIESCGKKEIGEFKLIDYNFFRRNPYEISGLRDSLEQLVRGVHTASIFSKENRIPLILLAGPTGSGKSEIQKCLEDGLNNDWEKNMRYTFVFKDDGKEIPCPHDEDPIHLLTSSIVPYEVRKKYEKYGSGDLCPSCQSTYEKLLRKKYEEAKNNQKKKGYDNFTDLLDEIVTVVPFRPKTTAIPLSHQDFPKIFENAVKRCNRGILHIDVDDKAVSKVPAINYQLLLKLRDKMVPLEDGSVLFPDLIVFLYADGKVLEDIKGNSNPLEDSIYPVLIRRNLSYTEEEKIYKRQSLPFDHFSPHSLKVLAKYAVGTRMTRLYTDSDTVFKKRLEMYDRYETGKPLTKEELETVKERLMKGDFPQDGWDSGVSSRKMLSRLLRFSFSPHRCMTLENVYEFLKEQERSKSQELSSELVERVSFADIMLAYTSDTVEKDGNIKKVEEVFSDYIDLLKQQKLEKKTKVEIPGKGEIPIDNILDDIAKKLNAYAGDYTKREGLNKAIDGYFDENGKKPTFVDLITYSPEVIVKSESIQNFVPWKEYQMGHDLSPHDKKRVGRLLDKLKELGYCEACGEAVIRIGAKKFIPTAPKKGV